MATPIEWVAVVQEGKELWAKLQERLAHPQDSQCGGLLVDEEYDVHWMQGGAWSPKDDLPFHLNDNGDMGHYSLVRVQCKGTMHVPYQNVLNGEDGVIVCLYNFKDQDFTQQPGRCAGPLLWASCGSRKLQTPVTYRRFGGT